MKEILNKIANKVLKKAVKKVIKKALKKIINKRREKNDKNALIIFTREPEPGKTKTRLMPYLSPEQCAELHRCMIRDIAEEMKDVNAHIIVAYTCGEPGGYPGFLHEVFEAEFIEQRGDGIGQRMENAVSDVLAMGYEKVILTGTDIPELEAESIDEAFDLLDDSDLVMGPTEDGGYYLIGMKALHREAFDVKLYGVSTVYEETAAAIRKAGLSIGTADTYADMDLEADIAGYRRRMRDDRHLRKSHTGRFLAGTAKISVIIPVYNEQGEAGRLIEQLAPYREECEIIFVDGGSTDDTVSLIRAGTGCLETGNASEDGGSAAHGCGISLISAPKGRGRQLNEGALASSGDILFFLHCDSVLPPDFTGEIRRVMASHEWGCFGVRFPSRNIFMLTNRIISNHRAVCRRLPFGDQGIFIDRTLFFEAGMFPDQPIMEDYEFSRRIRSKVKAPGLTRRRIVSSARRYGEGTRSILRTEFCMWRLRHFYRKGVSAERLQQYYRDIR